MSHLLDSALARQDPRLDITDVYVFHGTLGTVFVMCVNNSASGIDAPDGFCPNAHYDFRVDVNGDAVEDHTFRVAFGESESGRPQPLELRMVSGADARDHHVSGDLMAWGTEDRPISGTYGLRLWAGSAAEPFYVDPTVLEAVRSAVHAGSMVDLTAWQPRRAVNAFAGTSVCAIVLELPDAFLAGLAYPDASIGLWGTTTLRTDAGGWRPINRMGLPMVQTIFNPPDDERASEYNTTQPVDDVANYGELFTRLVARVVEAHGTADDPAAYAATVVGLILPDMLRYRIGTPASFSFAAFNGRGLTDNAPEVMFSIVTNCAISGGLTTRDAAGTPSAAFPYVRPRRELR